MKTKVAASLFTTLVFVTSSIVAGQDRAVSWWSGYSGKEASGPDVLGFWRFDGEGEVFTKDESSQKHKATLRGAKWHAEGRFGACLESAVGYPVADKSHGLHVARSESLSPRGAFTVEMWIRPKDEAVFTKTTRPVLLDMKYVPYNHSGFMLTLTQASGDGTRQMGLEIGLGARSDKWYSRPFALKPGQWRHISFAYDALGTVTFFVDGAEMGRMTKGGAGPMAVATRPLAIGDRIGSLYNGFPGFVDEVRISRGLLDFRPVKIVPRRKRLVFARMSERAHLSADLVNQTGRRLEGASITIHRPGSASEKLRLAPFVPGGENYIDCILYTKLKPGRYEVGLTLNVPKWNGGDDAYQATTLVPLVITPRPVPERMPVVMWGVGGVAGVVKEIPRLKEIGFTHCLGLGIDYQKVWDEGSGALPTTRERIRAAHDMLDTALENDIKVVATLSPASWLRRAEVGKPFLRIDPNGKHYGREDVSGLFKPVQDFCFNTGAVTSKAYGRHPAFGAALLHTEVRGESQVSFHPEEIAAYREATGADIPKETRIKNGVDYRKLADFPKDRVIPDDHPILQYLQWFWKQGDGWNGLNTRLHEGLKKNIGHDDFWTFHDPAVRVPSISGNGGAADVLSHWTYSYPDPIRIGLCTDELFEMARASGRKQDVMKMTQIIWYRSQTAPQGATPVGEQSPWVDRDPGAAYITIAPMHLREAFWWKLARPIQGIMYHGWQSLVETDSPGAYRYTNPHTQHELRRLIETVVVPLGPTLRQVPDAPADVAFLESFTSQMFARRGTYGWNHTWAGDMYHVLMYAHLQPRVLYEESLLADGLKGIKVLVMADCDVLTELVAKEIQKFQADGGLVIADAEVCPAIKPDFVLPRFSRTKKADVDRARLLAAAKELRDWLDERYSRKLDSTNPNVVTRRRSFGNTDYVFAVNDNREFGSYVGGYGLVMEDGIPSTTTIHLNRAGGHVYDLVARHEVKASNKDGRLSIPLELGPCDGRLLMVTERPIRAVDVGAPKTARRGDRVTVNIAVTDGDKQLDAVVPVQVRISDPEGIEAEFSGYYAAIEGALTINYDFAPNDRAGIWEIRAKELATGKSAAAYIRVLKPEE